jgi:predicted DNA-binding protein (UPF0278 family)
MRDNFRQYWLRTRGIVDKKPEVPVLIIDAELLSLVPKVDPGARNKAWQVRSRDCTKEGNDVKQQPQRRVTLG